MKRSISRWEVQVLGVAPRVPLLAAVVGVGGMVLALLTACSPSLGSGVTTASSGMEVRATETPLTNPAAQEEPELGIGLCLDGTISLGEELGLFQAARDGVAQAIARFGAVPHPATFLVARWVASREATRTSAAIIGSWKLPSLSPQPEPPAPVPTPEVKAFGGERLAEATRVASSAQATATAVAADWASRAVQSRAAADQVAAAILAAEWPGFAGSDIAGCVQVVAELLDGLPERLVVVVSDLERWPEEDPGNTGTNLLLDGIVLRVAYFACQEAWQCDERKAWFTDFVNSHGGKGDGVEFFFPGEPVEGLLESAKEVAP